jgi:hypothetical protein
MCNMDEKCAMGDRGTLFFVTTRHLELGSVVSLRETEPIFPTLFNIRCSKFLPKMDIIVENVVQSLHQIVGRRNGDRGQVTVRFRSRYRTGVAT